MNFFICPGAQKAGTTLLYDLLQQHPEIGLANKKETKFFLKEPRDISKKEYVDQFFSVDDSNQIYGEVDPEYMYYPDVPEKIYGALGSDVKFIFLLRHPVERAYSHYWMSYQRGFELLDFEEAIKKEPSRLKDREKKAIWHFSYIDRGYYSKQIERFLKYFPKQNFHYILFEEFVDNKESILDDIFEFLGVGDEDFNINTDLKSNKGAMPKSDLLRKLHGQPSNFKKALKVLIPFKKLRWWIYPIIENLNKSDKSYPALDEDIKRRLLEKYYSEEIEKLNTLTGLNMKSVWNIEMYMVGNNKC